VKLYTVLTYTRMNYMTVNVNLVLT